jgi:hypothetical protein
LSSQEIPDELKLLVRKYKEKLESGEAEKFPKNGFTGTGYQFTNEEKKKVESQRNKLKKGYMNESDDEELIEIKGKKTEEQPVDNSQALALKEKAEDSLRKSYYTNPLAKIYALEVGQTAAKVISFLFRTPF